MNSLCVLSTRIEDCGRMEVQFHPFLTSVLNGGESGQVIILAALPRGKNVWKTDFHNESLRFIVFWPVQSLHILHDYQTRLTS